MNNLSNKIFFNKALEVLISKNNEFSSLVEQVGIINFKKRELTFEAMTKIIINQQLSNNVAIAIFNRLKSLFKNNVTISPENFIDLDDKKIRDQGISYNKIKYMKNLSSKLVNRPELFNNWFKIKDNDALKEIQKLNGFGPWSANIILLFYMGRPNIFPFGDATLQKAYYNIYKKKLKIDLKGLDWAKPYRSIIALYFWKWVDNGMLPLNH